ncbi:MAG: efflux RND transporter periplasmic adaptor subunit, partial [Clostridia bacterium]|nr:efflux RND transporter periplasmic adaptor subunit [Clostridia bacterium]
MGIPKVLKKISKKKWIIIGAVLVVLIAVFVVLKVGKKASAPLNGTDFVSRGDVVLSITGSAAVEPYERYEIKAKTSGDIIESPYEVGDYIEKDTIVYRFDTSETDISMQKQEIMVDNSKNSYESALKDADKFYITAKASGIISDFDLEVGEDVSMGQKVGALSDTVSMKVTVPFNVAEAALISVGDSASVSSSMHMSSVEGKVTHKEANAHATSGGGNAVNVTISFQNPGALSEGMTVGAAVNGIISTGGGVIEKSSGGQITAETEGTITAIYHTNGDYVKRGDRIAKIDSDSLSNNIKSNKNNYENAKLSYEEAIEKLDDYNLPSPISGTVITKNAKAGDTIEMSTVGSTEPLMVVADISKLKFSLEIDELDVSKVSVGQAVEVTCDALPSESFIGEITNVSVEGTSTNGVTTYTADVVIHEPGNLRPSMNIDASVVLESSENTLMLPSDDIKTVGNVSFVYRKISDGTKTEENKAPQMPGGEKPEGMDMPDGERPEMPEGEKPEGMDIPQRSDKAIEAPDGFEVVYVEIGVQGDEYTEILSGLSEGDEVYRMSTSSSSDNMMGMMGMMG